MTTGNRITKRREELGMTQVQLADMVYQTIPVRTPPIMIQPYGIVVVVSY